MRLIERYLFRQLLGPTVVATLALGVVALLTQTLYALNIIVDQHQSAGVFARIIALSMPQMVALVLPIALFTAALMTLNRLHTEQEIVVAFAGGVSRWKVAQPFIRLSVFAAILTLVVNLWIAPWAQRTRQEELFRVKTDLVTSLVREGAFTQPSEGLTFYAQSSDKGGALHNIFIDQRKPDGSSTTFNAKTGQIVVRDGKPAMVIGTPGGSRIFTWVFQVLADVYDFDLSLKAAQKAPRFHHQLLPENVIFYEPSAPPSADLKTALDTRGYKWVKDFSGDMEAIQIVGRTPVPESDPRARGVSMVVK